MFKIVSSLKTRDKPDSFLSINKVKIRNDGQNYLQLQYSVSEFSV